MTAIRFVALTLLGLGALCQQAHATRCADFFVRFNEGATFYKLPAPQFELEQANSADADVTYWKIKMFDDVRAMMSCWHGWVHIFLAGANDSKGMSTVHALTLMSIGLYGHGLEWRKAIELRNSLMREANEAEPQIAKRIIDDVEASLIISFAGLPSFQIERVR